MGSAGSGYPAGVQSFGAKFEGEGAAHKLNSEGDG